MKRFKTIREYHEAGITPGTWILYLTQILRSILYRIGIFRPTSKSKPREKWAVLRKIEAVLTDSGRCNYDYNKIEHCMKLFSDRLEDPGLLWNFKFFLVFESVFMLTFYLNLWEGKVGGVMEYLHGYGWDLKGNYVKIPENDVWSMMMKHELMSIDARKKATNIIERIKLRRPMRAMSLGCGQVIERHYGLLDLFDKDHLTLVDKDKPDFNEEHDLHFVQKNLFDAIKEEGYPPKDFIWMTGVWPYFSEEEKIEVLKGVATSLNVGGHFTFDQVIINPSLLRAAITQRWPRDPKNPMTPSKSVKAAIGQVKEFVEIANNESFRRLDIEEISVVRCGDTAKKRYPTSVQFTLTLRC